MNILFIIHHLSKGGGPALRALEMTNILRKLGHSATILTMFPKEKILLNELTDLKIYFASKNPLYYLPPLASGAFARKAQQIIHDMDIDIIQTFDTVITGPAGVRVHWQNDIPSVVRIGVRGIAFYEYLLTSGHKGSFLGQFLQKTGFSKWLLTTLENETINGLNLLVPNSEYLANFYRPWLNPQKIKVIQNGVDLSVFRSIPDKNNDILSKLPLNDASNVITYIGRIEERKGLHILFNALKKVIPEYMNTKVLIIGSLQTDATYSTYLVKLAERLGIRDNICFLGSIPYTLVPNYISLSNFVILPSYLGWMEAIEGLPNIVLETMACSKPIVASETCGIPEIVEDGKTGFLCKPGCVSELYEKIAYLLDNPIIGKKVGNIARKYVERNHNSMDIVKMYINAYKAIL